MARSINVILTANPSGYISAMLKADAANTKVKASTAEVGAATTAVSKTTAKSAAEIRAAFASEAAAAERSSARLKASLAAQEAAMVKATAATTKYGKVTSTITANTGMINKASRALGLLGVAAGVAFGAAVKEAADFNAEMARVGAFSEDARAHMTQLRNLAMDKQFAAIGYSSKDAGEAMEELVKAGISATDMMNGGLKGALSLAAAGQIDVGQATEIAASAMTQFGLSGKDIPHVADLLAAGADKALGGVGDLGEALKYAGTTANQFGVSVDDTVGTLSAFASYGQLGSMAGTTLKEMFIKLSAPSAKAAKTMKEIGLNAYDAKGNFVGMSKLADNLRKSLGQLSPAQRQQAEATIFGARAMQGANILLAEGADGINDWIKKVNDQGFAAQTAARKLDSLQGDLSKFKASLTNAFVSAGEDAQSPLRGLIQTLTSVVNKWNDLSAATKGSVLKIVGGFAAIALAGAAFGKIVTSVAAVKTALVDLGVTAKTTGVEMEAAGTAGAAGMSKMKTAAGAAAGAVAGMLIVGQVANSIQGQFNPQVDQATTLLGQLSKGTKDASGQIDDFFAFKMKGSFGSVSGLDEAMKTIDGWSYKVNDFIENFAGITSPLDVAKQKFTDVDSALTNLVQSGGTDQAAAGFKQLANDMRAQGKSTDYILQKFPQYKAALKEQANALDVTNLSQQDYVNWMGGKVPQAVQDASAKIDLATDATDDQKSAADAVNPALQEYSQKSDDLKKKQEDLGKAVKDASDNFTILKDGAIDAAKASDEWQSSLNDLSKDAADTSSAQDQLASANDRVKDAEKNLNDVRKNSKSTNAEVRSAENQLRDARKDAKKAQDALNDATAQNSKTLKGNSDVAIANRGKIEDAVKAMNDKITADFKNEASAGHMDKATKDASKSLKQQKQDLIDTAGKAGYNRQEVKKMVDQMVLTPKELKTQVEAFGIDDLKKKIKDLQDQINEITSKDVKLQFAASFASDFKLPYTQGSTGNVIVSNHGHGHYATGGHVTGPGTGTSDSIPAWLSNGEFVVKEKAVRRLGVGRLNYLNETGTLPAFRDGGLVNTGGLNTGPSGQSITISKPILHLDARSTGLEKAATSIHDSFQSVIQNASKYAQVTLLQGLLQQQGAGVRLGGDNLVSWHGGRFTENFAKHLALAYKQNPFTVYQGGWNPGGVAASGSTHDKDAVDAGPSTVGLARALREVGIAAWQRTPAQGPWMAHVHGVPGPNVGIASPAAAAQYRDYLNGGNGLGGRDDGPKVNMRALATGSITGSAQTVFRQLMLAAGYPESDWAKVDYIISHESGWNIHATNPSSGAYGLGQAYPGSKMAAFGPDWRDNPETQGRWFFDYINRYGGLNGAYNFWRTHHWYADGGSVSGPGGPRDDKIPAMLSNGEFVVNARAAAKHRELLSLINSDQSVARFASGGSVGAGSFGPSNGFSVAAIVKLIRALDNPTAELAKFTRAVKSASAANSAAAKALKAPKSNLASATRTYNNAVDARNDLRLRNAKQSASHKDDVTAATAALKKQKDQLEAAKLALQKLAPAQSKAAAAQRALNSAISSRDSKARTNAEQIAKYNDKIAKAKKGTVAYQNLLNSKELAQKANRREMAAADEKVAKARKAAEKAGVSTAKVDAANLRVKRQQQDVDKAQAKLDKARAASSEASKNRTLKMAEANAAVTKASNAKKKAQDAYDKALDRAKAKSDAYKDAQEALKQAQQALAEAAQQTSEAFTSLYTSLDTGSVKSLLTSMKQGTKDIAEFTKEVQSLRNRGLNEKTLQDIISQAEQSGVAAGSTIASQILNGGKGTIDQLNKAATALQSAADVLGYKQATGVVRAASGGLITGAGSGTSDSIPARLSNGEYVVNARATAANRAYLDMINYGVTGRMSFAAGGYVSRPSNAAPVDVATAIRDSLRGMKFSGRIENGDQLIAQFEDHLTATARRASGRR